MRTNEKLLHDALIPLPDEEYSTATVTPVSDETMDDGGYMNAPVAPSPAAESEAMAGLMAPAHSAPTKQRRDWDTLRTERIEGALDMLWNPDAGLPWAWENLTKATDTIKLGDLVVVTAYTGSGKTTFLQNNVNAWAAMDEKVLYFGTEQSVRSLTFKNACLSLGVSFSDAVRGRLSPKWTLRLEKAIRAQGEAPFNNISFYPSPAPTLSEVERAMRLAVKSGIRNHVVDHLGCITPDVTNKATARMSRWEFVMYCIMTLKNLATELNSRCIIAAQLMAEETSDIAKHSKPNMKSVQGGQAVSQWADLCLGLFQPFRRGATDEEKLAVKRGEADISTVVEPQTAAVVQLKHREGMVARTELFWVKHNLFTPRTVEDTFSSLPASEYEDEVRAKEMGIWAEV
jgi:replicative DNA helicase